jgi:hypothetical protein
MLESTRPTSNVITISLDVIMPSVKSLPAIVYAPMLLANQAAITGRAGDGRDFRRWGQGVENPAPFEGADESYPLK